MPCIHDREGTWGSGPVVKNLRRQSLLPSGYTTTVTASARHDTSQCDRTPDVDAVEHHVDRSAERGRPPSAAGLPTSPGWGRWLPVAMRPRARRRSHQPSRPSVTSSSPSFGCARGPRLSSPRKAAFITTTVRRRPEPPRPSVATRWAQEPVAGPRTRRDGAGPPRRGRPAGACPRPARRSCLVVAGRTERAVQVAAEQAHLDRAAPASARRPARPARGRRRRRPPAPSGGERPRLAPVAPRRIVTARLAPGHRPRRGAAPRRPDGTPGRSGRVRAATCHRAGAAGR